MGNLNVPSCVKRVATIEENRCDTPNKAYEHDVRAATIEENRCDTPNKAYEHDVSCMLGHTDVHHVVRQGVVKVHVHVVVAILRWIHRKNFLFNKNADSQKLIFKNFTNICCSTASIPIFLQTKETF